MHKIEVCFSPVLYPHYENKNAIVVIVDVLRATSSLCSAFMNGTTRIIPVSSSEEAIEFKKKGYIVAAERNGITLDFADFGNSPQNFTPERVQGKEIVYCTTNGTKAFQIAKESKAVIGGSFLNLSVVAEWIGNQESDVVIFCAGWKKKFNLEDTLFAGALIDKLLSIKQFNTDCDAAMASLDLWDKAKDDLIGYAQKISWRKRLDMDDVFKFCLQQDISRIIPILKDDFLIPIDLN